MTAVFTVPDDFTAAKNMLWEAARTAESVGYDDNTSREMTQEEVEHVRLLLERHPRLARAPLSEETPLHQMAKHQNPGGVRLLLQHGAEADVNALDDEGKTPLHNAARRLDDCSLENCRLLLEHGADPNIQQESRAYTPLHLIILFHRLHRNGAEEAARLLLHWGANPYLECQAGNAFNCDDGKSILTTWITGWKKNVAKHFNTPKPSHSQCFTATDKGETLHGLVIDACATGLFAPVIAMPLIESTNPADRQLFKDIWNALPKHWQGQHQNIYMVFAKAGGLQPVLGAHTADACTPHGAAGRAL